MSYRDAETALQGQSNLLSAAGPTGPAERLKVLSRLVEEGRGECTPAAEHELVVPLRMGDMLPSTPEEVVESVRVALARPVMQNVTSVVFNAVMHYGANGMTGNFMRTPDTDAANMAFVDSLSQLCTDHLGVPISFRSEPSVDTDLCYLVHSPHVMIAAKKEDGHDKGGTFPLLVAELRAGAKGAQRHTLLTRPWSTVDSQTWRERRAVSGLGRFRCATDGEGGLPANETSNYERPLVSCQLTFCFLGSWTFLERLPRLAADASRNVAFFC